MPPGSSQARGLPALGKAAARRAGPSGKEECGVDAASGKVLVQIDPRYYRPTEVELLLGDPSKAKANLGWQAEVTLKELVAMMVAEDMQQAKREILCKRNGFEIHPAHE